MDELQRIYDSEMNVSISWLWDGGIDVKLGDEMNGYDAEASLLTVPEILPWLQVQLANTTQRRSTTWTDSRACRIRSWRFRSTSPFLVVSSASTPARPS